MYDDLLELVKNPFFSKTFNHEKTLKFIDYSSCLGFNWEFHKYLSFDKKMLEAFILSEFVEKNIPISCFKSDIITDAITYHQETYPFSGRLKSRNSFDKGMFGVYFGYENEGKENIAKTGFGISVAYHDDFAFKEYKDIEWKNNIPSIFIQNETWDSLVLSDSYSVYVLRSSESILKSHVSDIILRKIKNENADWAHQHEELLSDYLKKL